MAPATPITSSCSRRFRASRTSGTRDPSKLRWITWHDAEATDAEGVARFFETPTATGSTHLVVDGDVCYRTLDNRDIPWAALSAFEANLYGFHIEIAGRASWTSASWMLHRNSLLRAAYKTAYHCRLFDIPPRFVFAAHLPALDGITTHNEITMASKRLDPAHASKYNHTDPGRFFPRRWVMARTLDYYKALGSV